MAADDLLETSEGHPFDHLVTGYLTYRADTPARLTALLEADPRCTLAHCMHGYFAMLAFKQAVGRTEALRTGAYSATVTFTLSTTQP